MLSWGNGAKENPTCLKEAKRALIIEENGNVSKRAGIKGIAPYSLEDAPAQTKQEKSLVFRDDVPKRLKGKFEIVS